MSRDLCLLGGGVTIFGKCACSSKMETKFDRPKQKPTMAAQRRKAMVRQLLNSFPT